MSLPRIVPPVRYYWFNPAAFALPAPGTYGNDGPERRFTGPATHQIDFSVFKNFSITEHVKLQLRAEIFNIFNFRNLEGLNPNVQGPQQTVSGSNLGLVSATYDVGFGAPGIGPGAPRNIQLAGKIIF